VDRRTALLCSSQNSLRSGAIGMAQNEHTNENTGRVEWPRPFGKPEWRRDVPSNEENSDGRSVLDAESALVHGWRLWLHPKQVFGLLKATYAEYRKDNVSRMGAPARSSGPSRSIRF
jgi:hypothetical protein